MEFVNSTPIAIIFEGTAAYIAHLHKKRKKQDFISLEANRMGSYGEKLGLRIREIRRSKHETQLQLGISVGVVQQSVAAWEKGRSLPNIPSLIRIAEHYEVSSDWLLDLPNRM